MSFIILGERKPKVIDLFAGCGGMSLGFANAGYEIVAAFDNWDAAINVYRQNFVHPIFKQDLAASPDYMEFQAFPLNFQFSGTKSDMEQMIGNAVPVRLAEFVASALQMHTSGFPLKTR
jgi:site-specific DNA-cytosine methylase